MKKLCLILLGTLAPAETGLSEREQMLLERIEVLERRLQALEAKLEAQAGAAATDTAAAAPAAFAAPSGVPEQAPETTINVNLDGYYGYNFNRSYRALNPLRAYDVSGDGFSMNQTGILIERAPDPARGRRLGGRLDLMFGQATETLQGSPGNENRPEVFRHIFQAYGTYVAPLGNGLTVDFGKWASSFGLETNYTKDQFNYSRSYWFNFLPYYHMGFRMSYPMTRSVNASYWLVNGLNQTEDFNAFKSHAILFNFQPGGRLSANLNYFQGREERAPAGPTPRGRSHFLDSYFTWQATERWTLAGEADYAVSRVEPASAPRVVTGGAGYARYRFTPRFSLAGRFVLLRDAGGLFSGTSQSLKDTTLTATFDVSHGFQMRWEWRRDWSDSAFFPTADRDRLSRSQSTALLGLIWWFGGKPGAW